MMKEQKTMSLQEAMKQQLQAKKQKNVDRNNNVNLSTETKGLKNQVSKKTPTQHRRMGV
jgi:hypothetical protein